jgi:hypothetical protein
MTCHSQNKSAARTEAPVAAPAIAPIPLADLPGLPPDAARCVDVFADQDRGPVRLLTGFLHGLHPDLPDAAIRRLKPQYWREGSLAQSRRIVTGHGAALDVIVSCLCPDRPHPWEDFVGYADRVSAAVAAVRNKCRRVRYWEVWNEPQGGPFWHGTREQFLETFKVVHDAIRRVDADAWIGGPSWAAFDYNGTLQFLWNCRKHGVRLDFLAWHEIHSRPWEIPLNTARLRHLVGTKYPDLGIKEYHVNEWGSPKVGPGTQVAFFHYLDAAGIDCAAKTIWDMKEYLDDLMDGPLKAKTAYWAWACYAGGTGQRLRTRSNDPRLVALASRSSSGEVKVLVGRARNASMCHHDYEPNPSPALPPVAARIALHGLPAGRPVRVEIRRLPSDDVPLRERRIERSSRVLPVTPRTGRAWLTLPAVAEDEVYHLTLGRA